MKNTLCWTDASEALDWFSTIDRAIIRIGRAQVVLLLGGSTGPRKGPEWWFPALNVPDFVMVELVCYVNNRYEHGKFCLNAESLPISVSYDWELVVIMLKILVTWPIYDR
jgi:hypothetical protein